MIQAPGVARLANTWIWTSLLGNALGHLRGIPTPKIYFFVQKKIGVINGWTVYQNDIQFGANTTQWLSIDKEFCNTKGEGIIVPLTSCLVWNQLSDNWQFLFLFAKQSNPNQSNRRSTVQWYFPLKYSLCKGYRTPLFWKIIFLNKWKRINDKQSTTWQHLSRLKASAFFLLQKSLVSCMKCHNLY